MPYRSFPAPSPDLPHCSSDDVLTLEAMDAGEDTRKLVAEYKDTLDHYFASFVPGNLCPLCGSQISGILGTFTWGTVVGEGYCSHCTWPCRGLHDPKKPSGESVFVQTLPITLAYHPTVVAFAPSPSVMPATTPPPVSTAEPLNNEVGTDGSIDLQEAGD